MPLASWVRQARAIDAGDVRAAVELLRPAATLAKDDEMELETLVHLEGALDETAEYDEARAVLGRMVELAGTAGDPVFAMRVRLTESWDELRRNPEEYDDDAGRRLAEAAIRTFREHGARRYEPRALARLSSVEWDAGRMVRSVELQDEALEMAVDLGDHLFIRGCMINLLVTLDFGPATLSAAFRRASEFIERFTDDRATVSSALLERALIAAWLGRLGQARDDVAASRAIAEELGRRWDEQLYPALEGYVAWFDRRLTAAESAFREARQWQVDAEDRANRWFTVPPLARVLLELGRDADAEEILADLRAIPFMTSARMQGLSIAGLIAARRGDHDEARRLSREAEAIGAVTELLWDQADVALDKAEILLLAGRPADARGACAEGLAWFERKEYAIGIRRGHEILARLAG